MALITMADQALITLCWFKLLINWSAETVFPKSCVMGNEAIDKGGVCACHSLGWLGVDRACISVFTELRGFLRCLVLLFT